MKINKLLNKLIKIDKIPFINLKSPHEIKLLKDKIEELESDIETITKDSLGFLQKIMIEQKKIFQLELETAGIVQKALLPDSASFDYLELCSYYRVSQSAGGDWYNYWFDSTSGTFWCFTIDVTGHGVASSLITGVCSGVIRTLILQVPKQNFKNMDEIENYLINIVNQLNAIVFETGKKVGRILTMNCIVINCLTGETSILNAAHPFSIMKTKNNISSILITGNLVGYNLDSKYQCKRMSLKDDDEFFIYTDGLIENGVKKKQNISIKKIKAIMSEDIPIYEKKQKLINLIETSWDQSDFEDDVTFIIGKYKGLCCK